MIHYFLSNPSVIAGIDELAWCLGGRYFVFGSTVLFIKLMTLYAAGTGKSFILYNSVILN
jgi:hypothetical protein